MDVVGVSWVWAPAAVLLLMGVAAAGAAFSGALSAGATGQRPVAGLLAPAYEAARLMRQRRRVLLGADRPLWRGGGGTLLVAAVLMVGVVPLGNWTLADLGVGVVWVNAVDVLVWAAAWLLGWGANSAHALVGAHRYLAQALSYELPLMFALVAPAVAAGSLRVGDIVAAQSQLWFVVWMPASFALFCACVLAFSLWGPFSTGSGPDLAGGVLAELSGVDRLLVLAGRWALLAAGSAVAVALFLGGGAGPLLPAWAWSLLKTLLVMAALVVLARRLPLLRPDRLAEVGWLVCLPVALAQLLVVSLVVLGRS